jgi:transposase
MIRNLKVGHKITYISLFHNRLRCKSCGVSRMMSLPFVERWASYTRAVALEVIDLSKSMTLQDVANYLGLSWRAVKEIQKEHLLRRFRNPNIKALKNIGIDEICVGKGHRYMTVVVDLDTGRVVFMAEGKGGDALLPFWKRLKRANVVINAIAIDMGPAYHASVLEHQPQATIVFDHFHVIKLFNEKLTAFRRDLYNSLPDEEQREALKGVRWLLLKNSANLNEERQERKRLERALEMNIPLATVYYMKEELRQIWKQDSKEKAEVALKNWAKKAEASKIPMLKKFGYMLLGKRSGILAYYDNFLSTGPVEAINNKIKTIQRQAYGYRDQEFFRLKVYASHEAKFKLVG